MNEGVRGPACTRPTALVPALRRCSPTPPGEEDAKPGAHPAHWCSEATCANLDHPCRFGTELGCVRQTRG